MPETGRESSIRAIPAFFIGRALFRRRMMTEHCVGNLAVRDDL